MEVLLTPQIVNLYIKSRNKLKKTVEEKLVCDILESDSNSFLLNKNLLDFFESQFVQQTSELDFFRDEFAVLINERSVNVSASGSDLQKLLESMQINYLALSRNKTFVNLSFDNLDSTQTKHSASLQSISNKRDKLFFELAAYGSKGVTYFHHQFQTDIDILNLFNWCYDLRQGENVEIYDAFANVQHQYHDKLINESAKFIYYTKNISNVVDRNNNKNDIIAKYKRVAVKRGRRTDIHERRIIFSDMLIEASNDWQNLLIAEPTWKLDLFVCDKTCNIISLKRNNFSPS